MDGERNYTLVVRLADRLQIPGQRAPRSTVGLTERYGVFAQGSSLCSRDPSALRRRHKLVAGGLRVDAAATALRSTTTRHDSRRERLLCDCQRCSAGSRQLASPNTQPHGLQPLSSEARRSWPERSVWPTSGGLAIDKAVARVPREVSRLILERIGAIEAMGHPRPSLSRRGGSFRIIQPKLCKAERVFISILLVPGNLGGLDRAVVCARPSKPGKRSCASGARPEFVSLQLASSSTPMALQESSSLANPVAHVVDGSLECRNHHGLRRRALALQSRRRGHQAWRDLPQAI